MTVTELFNVCCSSLL